MKSDRETSCQSCNPVLSVLHARIRPMASRLHPAVSWLVKIQRKNASNELLGFTGWRLSLLLVSACPSQKQRGLYLAIAI